MCPERSSRLPKLYDLPIERRREIIAKTADLRPEVEKALHGGKDGLTPELADKMIENVIGVFGLPMGIAANFIINGKAVFVPMVIEEPSVVAGASFMAKLIGEGGGFVASTSEPEMIAQIQVLDIPDLERATENLIERKDEILAEADQVDPKIVSLGGGSRDLEIRILEQTPTGPMLIVHLIFDTRDAMGANTLNSAAERIAPLIEDLTSGRVHLKIISNLADRRLAKAECRVPLAALAFDQYPGEQVRDGIIEAWSFAAADPYRAATHNKGIMNGIDAVVVATGNDWRAVEAGAHAYASLSGSYTSLSRWEVGQEGDLSGELEMPLAVGVVGGATRVHPAARACLELMGVKTARELAEIIVSVGLAQNLAALRALATEGIQRGHMALHARQIAIAAGAEGELVEKIVHRMIAEKTIHIDRAHELIQEWD